MKGFAATFLAIFVICAFAACESTPRNDGTTRYAAGSPYNGPGSEPVLPPKPDLPPVPERPVSSKPADDLHRGPATPTGSI